MVLGSLQLNTVVTVLFLSTSLALVQRCDRERFCDSGYDRSALLEGEHRNVGGTGWVGKRENNFLNERWETNWRRTGREDVTQDRLLRAEWHSKKYSGTNRGYRVDETGIQDMENAWMGNIRLGSYRNSRSNNRLEDPKERLHQEDERQISGDDIERSYRREDSGDSDTTTRVERSENQFHREGERRISRDQVVRASRVRVTSPLERSYHRLSIQRREANDRSENREEDSRQRVYREYERRTSSEEVIRADLREDSRVRENSQRERFSDRLSILRREANDRSGDLRDNLRIRLERDDSRHISHEEAVRAERREDSRVRDNVQLEQSPDLLSVERREAIDCSEDRERVEREDAKQNSREEVVRADRREDLRVRDTAQLKGSSDRLSIQRREANDRYEDRRDNLRERVELEDARRITRDEVVRADRRENSRVRNTAKLEGSSDRLSIQRREPNDRYEDRGDNLRERVEREDARRISREEVVRADRGEDLRVRDTDRLDRSSDQLSMQRREANDRSEDRRDNLRDRVEREDARRITRDEVVRADRREDLRIRDTAQLKGSSDRLSIQRREANDRYEDRRHNLRERVEREDARRITRDEVVRADRRENSRVRNTAKLEGSSDRLSIQRREPNDRYEDRRDNLRERVEREDARRISREEVVRADRGEDLRVRDTDRLDRSSDQLSMQRREANDRSEDRRDNLRERVELEDARRISREEVVRADRYEDRRDNLRERVEREDARRISREEVVRADRGEDLRVRDTDRLDRSCDQFSIQRREANDRSEDRRDNLRERVEREDARRISREEVVPTERREDLRVRDTAQLERSSDLLAVQRSEANDRSEDRRDNLRERVELEDARRISREEVVRADRYEDRRDNLRERVEREDARRISREEVVRADRGEDLRVRDTDRLDRSSDQFSIQRREANDRSEDRRDNLRERVEREDARRITRDEVVRADRREGSRVRDTAKLEGSSARLSIQRREAIDRYEDRRDNLRERVEREDARRISREEVVRAERREDLRVRDTAQLERSSDLLAYQRREANDRSEDRRDNLRERVELEDARRISREEVVPAERRENDLRFRDTAQLERSSDLLAVQRREANDRSEDRRDNLRERIEREEARRITRDEVVQADRREGSRVRDTAKLEGSSARLSIQRREAIDRYEDRRDNLRERVEREDARRISLEEVVRAERREELRIRDTAQLERSSDLLAAQRREANDRSEDRRYNLREREDARRISREEVVRAERREELRVRDTDRLDRSSDQFSIQRREAIDCSEDRERVEREDAKQNSREEVVRADRREDSRVRDTAKLDGSSDRLSIQRREPNDRYEDRRDNLRERVEREDARRISREEVVRADRREDSRVRDTAKLDGSSDRLSIQRREANDRYEDRRDNSRERTERGNTRRIFREEVVRADRREDSRVRDTIQVERSSDRLSFQLPQADDRSGERRDNLREQAERRDARQISLEDLELVDRREGSRVRDTAQLELSSDRLLIQRREANERIENRREGLRERVHREDERRISRDEVVRADRQEDLRVRGTDRLERSSDRLSIQRREANDRSEDRRYNLRERAERGDARRISREEVVRVDRREDSRVRDTAQLERSSDRFSIQRREDDDRSEDRRVNLRERAERGDARRISSVEVVRADRGEDSRVRDTARHEKPSERLSIQQREAISRDDSSERVFQEDLRLISQVGVVQSDRLELSSARHVISQREGTVKNVRECNRDDQPTERHVNESTDYVKAFDMYVKPNLLTVIQATVLAVVIMKTLSFENAKFGNKLIYRIVGLPGTIES